MAAATAAPTAVEGAVVVTNAIAADHRGTFLRMFDRLWLASAGVDFRPDYLSISTNPRAATLRGLHIQRAPFAEQKLVSCVRGRVHDVVFDLRVGSSTYMRWAAVELSAGDGRSLYVPRGCAHGFLTLEDESQVSYLIAGEYRPDHAFGVRWDDPIARISWPAEPVVISERDASYPALAG